ncbi:MAG: ribosomal L7Ae/L30e/S12e/Gadd45 family protein [Ruminococcus sp.]|nr:ribosomal L7Ae/L30e/S12e/Gadd45 family protein [Ruminococcus sp.]
MNDRILSLLGLCRRAGKLTLGFDLIVEAVENGDAALVLTARDISKNTEKKLLSVCERNAVKISALNRSKDELSFSLGKLTAAAAVCDAGFAEKLSELLNSESGGNCL